MLKDCFAAYGAVFRIGGDEFNAFLYDMDETDWEMLKKVLRKNWKKITKMKKYN